MRVEESTQVASFILCWFFLQRSGFLHSADAQGLNDKPEGGSVYPHRLYMQRLMAMDHRRYIAWSIQPHRLYSKRGGRGTAQLHGVYSLHPPAGKTLQPRHFRL